MEPPTNAQPTVLPSFFFLGGGEQTLSGSGYGKEIPLEGYSGRVDNSRDGGELKKDNVPISFQYIFACVGENCAQEMGCGEMGRDSPPPTM